MVVFGSNPMNECWASFSGPSMDSKRYAFSYCFWSFENISRGCWFRVICLIFRGLTGLVVVGCVPKAIPHLSCFLIVQKHTAMFYLRLTSTQVYTVT